MGPDKFLKLEGWTPQFLFDCLEVFGLIKERQEITNISDGIWSIDDEDSFIIIVQNKNQTKITLWVEFEVAPDKEPEFAPLLKEIDAWMKS